MFSKFSEFAPRGVNRHKKIQVKRQLYAYLDSTVFIILLAMPESLTNRDSFLCTIEIFKSNFLLLGKFSGHSIKINNFFQKPSQDLTYLHLPDYQFCIGQYVYKENL